MAETSELVSAISETSPPPMETVIGSLCSAEDLERATDLSS